MLEQCTTEMKTKRRCIADRISYDEFSESDEEDETVHYCHDCDIVFYSAHELNEHLIELHIRLPNIVLEKVQPAPIRITFKASKSKGQEFEIVSVPQTSPALASPSNIEGDHNSAKTTLNAALDTDAMEIETPNLIESLSCSTSSKTMMQVPGAEPTPPPEPSPEPIPKIRIKTGLLKSQLDSPSHGATITEITDEQEVVANILSLADTFDTDVWGVDQKDPLCLESDGSIISNLLAKNTDRAKDLGFTSSESEFDGLEQIDTSKCNNMNSYSQVLVPTSGAYPGAPGGGGGGGGMSALNSALRGLPMDQLAQQVSRLTQSAGGGMHQQNVLINIQQFPQAPPPAAHMHMHGGPPVPSPHQMHPGAGHYAGHPSMHHGHPIIHHHHVPPMYPQGPPQPPAYPQYPTQQTGVYYPPTSSLPVGPQPPPHYGHPRNGGPAAHPSSSVPPSPQMHHGSVPPLHYSPGYAPRGPRPMTQTSSATHGQPGSLPPQHAGPPGGMSYRPQQQHQSPQQQQTGQSYYGNMTSSAQQTSQQSPSHMMNAPTASMQPPRRPLAPRGGSRGGRGSMMPRGGRGGSRMQRPPIPPPSMNGPTSGGGIIRAPARSLPMSNSGMKRPSVPMPMVDRSDLAKRRAMSSGGGGDADCQVVFSQPKRTGIPQIQNVQGNVTDPQSLTGSTTTTTTSRASPNIMHLSDSITLSVLNPSPKPACEPSKTDAKGVADILATRGITVTPTAKSTSNGPAKDIGSRMTPTVDLTDDNTPASKPQTTGAKPMDELYRCDQCGATFVYSARLERHKMLKHRQAPPAVDYGVPLVDLRNPAMMSKLTAFGIYNYIPMPAQSNGHFALPIISMNAVKNNANLGQVANAMLTLGPIRRLPARTGAPGGGGGAQPTTTATVAPRRSIVRKPITTKPTAPMKTPMP